jgi:hypothetical protein
MTKDEMKEYQRMYRKENKEKLLENRKKYNESHINELKEYNKDYYLKNKERIQKRRSKGCWTWKKRTCI